MLLLRGKRNGGSSGSNLLKLAAIVNLFTSGGKKMNTSEVAKLLGVSSSTIQRWVKQLELPMERNERGHYHFNQEDIDLLKNIHNI